MLLLGKTQKKHPGDRPPMVLDLPLHPQVNWVNYRNGTAKMMAQMFTIIINTIIINIKFRVTVIVLNFHP